MMMTSNSMTRFLLTSSAALALCGCSIFGGSEISSTKAAEVSQVLLVHSEALERVLARPEWEDGLTVEESGIVRGDLTTLQKSLQGEASGIKADKLLDTLETVAGGAVSVGGPWGKVVGGLLMLGVAIAAFKKKKKPDVGSVGR